ncbi:MAG: hypothetical protein U0229_16940 [Anaeromyxobacter sp.]
MPRRLLPLFCLLAAAPGLARAGELLDDALTPPLEASPAAAPDLTVHAAPILLASAGDPGKKDDGKAAQPAPGGLDFDLLGEAKPPPDAPDAEELRLRRKLLTWHQGLGLGLLGLELATTAVGQLNYRDKFGTPANTGKWRAPHAALALATTAAFAVNAGFALAAPAPVKREWKLDRVMVHRIALFTASAGMLTQVGLGFYTSSREGYVNQRQMAKTHLYVGYGTLAAILTGVGVIVF